MSENLVMIDPILDKKLNGYKSEQTDFVAQGEITITITLNEYRDLVIKAATREDAIRRAEKGKWEKEKETENLKKQIEALTSSLCELQEKQIQVMEVVK